MTPIYSALQLPRLYELTCQHLGIKMGELIERCANGFVQQYRLLYGKERPLYILAGPDMNGAIALAVARLLAERDYTISCYLFYQRDSISDPTQEQRRLIMAQGIIINEISTQFSPPTIQGKALVVDGLFGSELARSLEGGFLHLVAWINGLGCDVVSIDLPSGLFVDDNGLNNNAGIVKARHTISFETPKLAMLLAEQHPYVGSWHIISLGIPSEVHRQFKTQYHCINERSLAKLIRQRKPFSSEVDYGCALLIGGGRGAVGLLGLQAQAAYLVGCGSVHISSPHTREQDLIALCPEAVYLHKGEDGDAGGDNPEGTYHLPQTLRPYSALAVLLDEAHEGLSTDELRNLFSSSRKPLILDGAAIRSLSEHPKLLDVIPEDSILMLSQSARSRLLKTQTSDLAYLYAAQTFASRYRVNLVLRGTYTSIVRSSGYCYFNTTGHAGMAKRGTPDILSALITGLLARGYDSLGACLIGTYVWGAAADLYTARYGIESLRASDLLAEIPTALHNLSS